MTVPKEAIYAPDFPKNLDWIGSAPIKWRHLHDRKVVLVDFWDFSCVNCLRTLPYLAEWNRRYRSLGLTTIGVHSPEFSFAADSEAVESAVERLGIEYPIVVDSQYEIWKLYGNRVWPAKYLWDEKGKLVWFHFGEGEYEATELAIQKALRNLNPDVELKEPMGPVRDSDRPGARCLRPTPELYLGSERGQPPVPVEREGEWRVAGEFCESLEPGTQLTVTYEAAGANIVLAPPETGSSDVDVLLDGKKLKTIKVDGPQMYELVDRPEHEQHKLTLRFHAKGTRAYAFTFTPGCVS